jgi:hypothetical protein
MLKNNTKVARQPTVAGASSIRNIPVIRCSSCDGFCDCRA